MFDGDSGGSNDKTISFKLRACESDSERGEGPTGSNEVGRRNSLDLAYLASQEEP